MGRPTTIDDARILDIARDVFLKKGVNATTAEVAKKAGISQASIFKHFKTKQRLFIAAMQAEGMRQDWMGQFDRRQKEIGLQEAMVELGATLVGFFVKVLPLALVSWSNRGEFGLPEELTSNQGGPMRAAQRLVAILEAEMKAGRLAKHNPWLVARTFVGSLQSYALITHVFKHPFGPALEPEQYVRGVVGVLWRGIAPCQTGTP